MAFLNIDGIEVEVSTNGATMREPTRQGASARAFAGNLRTTFRGRKRNWTFSTGPLTEALLDMLLWRDGKIVSCTGTALNSTVVYCEVLVTDASYEQDGLGHIRLATLNLAEA